MTFTPTRQLLSPPIDLTCFPKIVDWQKDLVARLKVLADLPADEQALVKLSVVCNQASLLLYFVDNSPLSRQLCQASVRAFLELFSHTGERQFLNAAVQPWINIARLDRLEGNASGCLARLEAINPCGKGELYLGELSFSSSLLSIENCTVIQSNVVLEHIKGWLSRLEFGQILEAYENKIWPLSLPLAEAVILAKSALGEDDASSFCVAMMGRAQTAHDRALFYLRLCELLAGAAGERDHSVASMKRIPGMLEGGNIAHLKLKALVANHLCRLAPHDREVAFLADAVARDYESLGEVLHLGLFVSDQYDIAKAREQLSSEVKTAGKSVEWDHRLRELYGVSGYAHLNERILRLLPDLATTRFSSCLVRVFWVHLQHV